MGRTPEDLSAPPNVRPPHVDPHWWARASWRARQTAIDAWNRAQRPADTIETNTQHIRATTRLTRAEKVTAVDEMLHHLDLTASEIAARLGTTCAALDVAMRREGRIDLARPFQEARDAERHRTCADCGQRCNVKAERCQTCSNREIANRAEVREAHRRNAANVRPGKMPAARRAA